MTSRLTARFPFILAIVIVFLLTAGVSSSWAATPSSAPMQVVPAQGFEGATFAPWTVSAYQISAEPTVVAYWGSVTAKSHSGLRSLWVAGSVAGGGSNVYGVYPFPSSGLMRSNVDLSQYYSAKIGFWYNLGSYPGTTTVLPDMGALDTFLFGWWQNGVLTGQTYQDSPGGNMDFPITGAASWTQKTYSLTSWSGLNLSRKRGHIEFRYLDFDEYGDPHGFPLSPPDGRGVCIDDVSITGYKYGPVRSVTAVRGGGKVQLTWKKPATSTWSSADDTRSIAYRVWRADDFSPYQWTELTGNNGAYRVTGTALTDLNPSHAASRYFVQAWDPGAGTGYGEGNPNAAAGQQGVATVPWDGTVTQVPVEGGDRFGTAIAASRSAFATGSCDTVIISTGMKYADALGAAGLAGSAHAPILSVGAPGTTDGTTLRADILAEMRRVTSGKTKKTVYVLGSNKTVSDAMFNSIKSKFGTSGVTYKRLYGADRWKTAQAIAREAKVRAGSSFPKAAIFTTGLNYPDALLAGPAAYASKTPILLVDGSVDASLTQTIKQLGITKATIIGSTTAVSSTIMSDLTKKAGIPAASVTRPCALADKYQQSVSVAGWATKAPYSLNWGDPGIASGDSPADALGAGVVQGEARSPLLLTTPTTVSTVISTELAKHKGVTSTLRFFGSTKTIWQTVRDAYTNLLK